MEQTATIAEVKEVGITDRQGRYLINNRRDRVGERMDHPLLALAIEGERRQINYEGDQFIVIQPLHGDDYLPEHLSDVTGAIIITMDLAPLQAHLRRDVLVAFLAAIIIVIFFSVSIMVIVKQLVVRPIKSLSEASKRLSAGNWEVEVHYQVHDEIGELAGSFNLMARALQEREKILQGQKEELQKAHDELEQRVEERTFELTRANERLDLELIERRRAEEALRESQKRYRAVVEDQTELVLRFLPDFTLTFVNNALSKLLGIPNKELIGRRFTEFLDQENCARLTGSLESISSQAPIAIHEHKIVSPAGSVGWQQWVNRGFFDMAGQVIEYQAVGRDITDLKRAH